MDIKEFSFNLPPHLIAQYPSDKRGESRLLVVERKTQNLIDSSITDLTSFLPQDAVMVINDSKVRKARVYGISDTGSKVEFLFLSPLADNSWLVMVSKSKRQRIGKSYTFSHPTKDIVGTIIDETVDGKVISFNTYVDESFFDTIGHVPLPPYIKREDVFEDESRYQTIYAATSGSVAAPTAGLHFTHEVLESIKKKNITLAPVTLHVGPGTFLPVRSSSLEEHVMHKEYYEISEQTSKIVTLAKKEKRPVIAVGTTSVRTIESAWDNEKKELTVGKNSTNLFITPHFQFKVVDHLMTNFHTPESTLLVLVSSFASKEMIEKAYQHAVEKEYRFFSYGDAMLIL
ncbi:MAG: tRNA preQ1(34) S-adenosylmethionine ribosyltransferase-isomerase QueA [Spirochaetia bacterium]|nr:tRNA preQ1(34) S-adenosylmethionine ribosyltransferase-isomerase QueA [Spirochaetia bacterium]